MISILGDDLREKVKHCLQPSVKHGLGSVMIYGCISDSFVGDIVKIDRIMNVEK